MTMEQKIKELLNRYQSGQCTEEEKAWVETWYNNFAEDAAHNLSDKLVQQDLEEIYNGLSFHQTQKSTNHWMQIAASVFLLFALSIGVYIYLKPLNHQALAILRKVKKHDSSIISKSYLTLANGTTISLDHAAIGKIAEQGGMKITKIKEGLIAYTSIPYRKKESGNNMVKTTMGGQYQIILPDGTRVWLNAVTSLKFPTAFSGKKREVELEGEGYFEVSKSKTQLFKVLTKHQIVEVLGTHFNINSYPDESLTKTTLLEGKVKVIQLKTQTSVLLKPGEQSLLEDNANIKTAPVDISNVIAWQRGLFQFQNSDIESVMRQLSRWYDVDIEFEGKVSNTKLWGEFHRNESLVKTLEILDYFNFKYKILNESARKKIIIKTNN